MGDAKAVAVFCKRAQSREAAVGLSPPHILLTQPFPLWKHPSSSAALGSQLQTPHPLLFPDYLKMPQLCCAARWDLLGKEWGRRTFPSPWLWGAGTPQLPREPWQGCTVWAWEKSQSLGKWVSICSLDPDNKRTEQKTRPDGSFG